MKKDKLIVIETTYPNLESAKNLAKILLSEKLAACIHFHAVESMYVWREKIENDQEFLMRIKTKNSLYESIEKVIKKHHEYKVPEIIVLPIEKAEEEYSLWIKNSTVS